jgi:hypothetical protein
MGLELRSDDVREEFAVRPDDGRGGLIAGSLDAKNMSGAGGRLRPRRN